MTENTKHTDPAKLPIVACLAIVLTVSLFAGAALAQREGVSGPDVTVIYLGSTAHYGESGGIHGYAVGTTSCNVGTEPLWWCNDAGDPFCETNQHPVIAQNLYRLKEGRFEQIGMSWLKHGFLSTNTTDSACGPSCVTPPHGNDQLGLGCTDTYGAGLNGSRPLGMRSEVDAFTGDFPYPYTNVGSSGPSAQRIEVEEVDLDPTLNPGALYWVEGQYIAADDAASGNAHNNASYRAVTVSTPSYDLSLTGSTIREQPAIMAWKTVDPLVQIHKVNVGGGPGREGELFNAARKVTFPEGVVHYEYALHNLQSERGANRFTIQFPGPIDVWNMGFSDVKHHSGEPYSTEDWTYEVDEPAGTVTWYTDDFATNDNANALRWGTTFSFWFDSYSIPDDAVHTLTLFKPGLPADVVIPFTSDFGIFSDGFESGDTAAWSVTLP